MGHDREASRGAPRRSVWRLVVYGGSLVFFFLVVLAPALVGFALKWSTIFEAFEKPETLDGMLPALTVSFQIAGLATVVDIVAGLPTAWLISRSRRRWVDFLDTLIDMPLVMPTVALGYSVLLYWSGELGISRLFGHEITSPGWLLIFFLHLTFTFPYVVRTLVGIIRETNLTYEVAARTLGATPFTTFRTVSLPLIRRGVLAAISLSFSRSLSETGATLMVAGAVETATVYIKNKLAVGVEVPLVVTSLVLIGAAVLVLLATKLVAEKLRLPATTAFPRLERRLSSPEASRSRDIASIGFFLLLIIAPAFFIFAPAFSAAGVGEFSRSLSGAPEWSGFWNSVITSFEVAAATVAVNVAFGVPMAVALARNKFGKAGRVIDTLVNVPLIVPTVALGTSLRFFWLGLGFSGALPEIVLITLAHISFTYPFIVRTTAASMEAVDPELENTARTLGASPLSVFRTVTFPLSANALFAGVVMAFTRSVDETGATIAVAFQTRTAPIFLVDWVRGAQEGVIHLSRAAWGCIWLTLISFIVMLLSRRLARRR